MGNLKMNIGEQGVEQDRAVQELNYNNVDRFFATTKPMTPYDQPAALQDDVNRSSDTKNIDVGPSAMDITARTRNG